jgi:hypothetical protein
MSQLVKTKRQANFKDFKRFGAFKGLIEQKSLFNSFVCKLTSVLKAHECQKRPNLHTNSLNKLLLCLVVFNDTRAASVIFNMLLQIVHTNSEPVFRV